MMRRHARWLVLSAFWIASYPVLLGMFAGSERSFVDYLYTWIFWVTLLLPAFVGEAWLRPRWLTRGRNLGFLAIWTLLVLVGALFNQIFFSYFVDWVFPGYYFISYYGYWDIVKFFLAFAALSTLVGMAIEWFGLQASARDWALLEKRKVDAEFQALSNQLQPHFLFNSLAVIHSMAIQKKPDTSEAVLHLSNLLRYVVYRSSGEVSMEDEVKLLSDYIELQKYRVHPSTRIDIHLTGNLAEWKIAPMLLLPLLENAFKHGVQSVAEGAYIKLSIDAREAQLAFDLKNSFFGDQAIESAGGVGLTSVRQRLQLLYPGAHRFSARTENGVFHVQLTIDRDSISLDR